MAEKVASYNSLLCLQMWTAQLSAAVMRRRETGILHELGKGWHKIEAANTQSHYPDTGSYSPDIYAGSYGNGTINLIHYLGRWNVHTSSDLALIILATEFLAWQCIAELSALEGIEWQTRIDTHELQNRVVTIIAKGNPIGSCPFHLTTTTHVLETLRTFVIPSPGYEHESSLLLQLYEMTPLQMFWGLSVYCGCKVNCAAAYWVAFYN